MGEPGLFYACEGGPMRTKLLHRLVRQFALFQGLKTPESGAKAAQTASYGL